MYLPCKIQILPIVNPSLPAGFELVTSTYNTPAIMHCHEATRNLQILECCIWRLRDRIPGAADQQLVKF